MFQHYISLGYDCRVAASLKKLGFRETSSPFDWYFTDFNKVMEAINNHFIGILEERNLKIELNNPSRFIDEKYGFYYIHELQPNENLSEKLPEIREKYLRRITRFYNMINEPTCFVRKIRSYKEIIYINKTYEEIIGQLKAFNSNNELIFIVARKICQDENIIKFPHCYWVEEYKSTDTATGELINRAGTLVDFLVAHYRK